MGKQGCCAEAGKPRGRCMVSANTGCGSSCLKLCQLKEGEEEEYLRVSADAWIERGKGKIIMEREIADFFRHGGLREGICLAFKLESEIVGTAFMVERQHDLNGVDLFNIAIGEKHRGKGMGLRMMEMLFEEAKKYEKRWAFVSTDGKTDLFYKKCGMKELGKILRARNNRDRVYLYKQLD
jgi:predicted N-acetyltransferase YhbS